MSKPQLRITVALAAAYVLALMLIAFWPTPVDRPASGTLTQVIGWLHQHGMPAFIGYNKIEFAANIVLFLPLGFIAAGWAKKWWHPLAAGFAASCLIELGQAFMLPQRFASVLDIVANTAGAALGVGIHIFWHERRKADPDALAATGDAAPVSSPEGGNPGNRNTGSPPL